MNRIVSTICIFLFTYAVYGQDGDIKEKTYFTTKAIDNEDNTIFIPFAHVFNESLRTSAISDTLGVIKLRANINDTLVITAIGYYPRIIIVSEGQVNPENPINTILERRRYAIQEVSVHALGTYEQFKKKVENLDLPYTKEEQLRADLKEMSIPIAIEALENAKQEMMLTTTPLPKVSSSPYNILSRDEKQRKKYDEMLKKEERKTVIYAKFNKIVVKKLTELTEPELTDFFVFCNFNEEFLFDASEYEVSEAIKNKFALYLAMKQEQDETKDTLPN